MSEVGIDHEILGVTRLTLNLPRSDCQFSPLAATHFLVNYSWEFGVRSSYQYLSDKSGYSHYLFVG